MPIHPGSTDYTKVAVCDPSTNIYKNLLGTVLGEWAEIELNKTKIPI